MQDPVGYTTVGGDLEGSLSVIENDPVCDAAVDVEAARESGLIAEFADRIYAFCGTACRDRFLAEPALYSVAGGRTASLRRSPDWRSLDVKVNHHNMARPPFDRLQQLLEDWLAELPLAYTHSAD